MNEMPDSKRRIIKRTYKDPMLRLRRVFNIPSYERIISFKWDKRNNELVLITGLDYDKNNGDK